MSQSPAGNSPLPLLLLVILAAAACSKSSPKQAGDADSVASVAAMEQGDSGKAARPAVVIPKDLVPVALASAQKKCGYDVPDEPTPVDGGPVANATCKNYEVSAKASKHLPLKAADRANGYEDTWCVTTAYLVRIGQAPWQDVLYPAVYAKHGGAWHFEAEYLPGARC